MFKILSTGLVLALFATGVSAEVRARTDNGFTLGYERPVRAGSDTVLETVAMPSGWWSSDHTYSGDAANIRLDMIPGGCWCEAVPGGGVKHAEVVMVWPGRRMVRFDAPFGPLQGMGADAVLTMTWADPPEGGERVLRWTFVVNGPGTGAMADAIDGVMTEQFRRLGDRLDGL
ncbi:MAG: ATPase [bacterium]